MVVHLILARNTESLLLKYFAIYPGLLDTECARYPSRYIGQDVLCNALQALNNGDTLCLLQAGARLRENVKYFAISWTKYRADQDAFHENLALVERPGLPPLKLDIYNTLASSRTTVTHGLTHPRLQSILYPTSVVTKDNMLI